MFVVVPPAPGVPFTDLSVEQPPQFKKGYRAEIGQRRKITGHVNDPSHHQFSILRESFGEYEAVHIWNKKFISTAFRDLGIGRGQSPRFY